MCSQAPSPIPGPRQLWSAFCYNNLSLLEFCIVIIIPFLVFVSHLFNRSFSRLINVVWFNNISFLFLSNSSFYSICNSCINWWIFGFLPVWGLLWVMRYIHSCTCLCVSVHFHFCWENIGRLHGWEQWASEGLCAWFNVLPCCFEQLYHFAPQWQHTRFPVVLGLYQFLLLSTTVVSSNL